MNTRASSSQMLALIGWLALCFAAAALGGAASIDAPGFYAQLLKPAWAPPAGAFGPVWTTLYVLMGIAAWLVWRSPQRAVFALGVFVTQLAANAAWTWLFFVFRRGDWAFAEILLLLALLLVTLALFWRHSRLAALLLLPYLAWTGFACALTWSVWRANPGLL